MQSAIPHFKRLLGPEKIPTNIISVESEVTTRISLKKSDGFQTLPFFNYLNITEIRELKSCCNLLPLSEGILEVQ